MNLDIVKKAVLDWIVAETGLPNEKVIFERQSEQRPKRPYATILFVNPGSRLGAVDQLKSETSGPTTTFMLSGLRSALISINIIGDKANDTMSKLLNTLDRPDVGDKFEAAGFTVMDEVGPTDLSELLETKWEERSQMDLEINYAHNTATDLEYIATAEVEADIEFGINN